MDIKLKIEGKTYLKIRDLKIEVKKAVNDEGFPTASPKGGLIGLTIPFDHTTERHPAGFFFEWMMDKGMKKDGLIQYFRPTDPDNPAMVIKFSKAFCIHYSLEANSETGAEETSLDEIIKISPQKIEVDEIVHDKSDIW